MINLCDRVMTVRSIEGENVCAGETGVVVLVHGEREAFTVEFVDELGCVRGLCTAEAAAFTRVEGNASVRLSADQVCVSSPSMRRRKSTFSGDSIFAATPVHAIR